MKINDDEFRQGGTTSKYAKDTTISKESEHYKDKEIETIDKNEKSEIEDAEVPAWRRHSKPQVCMHCHLQDPQTKVETGYVPACTKHMMTSMHDEDEDAVDLMKVEVAKLGMQGAVPEHKQLAAGKLSKVLVSEVETAERQRLQPKQNIHVLAAERAPSVSRLWGQKAAGTPAWRRELKPQVHVQCHLDEPQTIVGTGYVPACNKHMMTSMHESVPLELQAKLKLKKQEPREENDEESPKRHENAVGIMAVEVANSGAQGSVPEPQQLAAGTLSTVLVSEVEALEG
ncbi:unnamed protein product, partial [Schistocephalus solidus]|uniref:Paralemmin-2 n=1 Tax=Schistocephalus solidus TaxID=70667 RepID=A0A183S9D5_SCHSO